MKRDWVRATTSNNQQLVVNLAHVARVEVGPDGKSVALVAVQHGQLKIAGVVRGTDDVESLTALVEGAPGEWIRVQPRDSMVPSTDWVNAAQIATAALATSAVEMFAHDGSWLGTAGDPHAVKLARNALGI
jgi:hypothetical protein